MTDTRYALDTGQVGNYTVVLDESGEYADLPRALHAAFDELRIQDIPHVTVVRYDGHEITAVCSVVPPIAPPATSPETGA